MGNRLRERREHADLSLGQVAQYEQIGRQYLSKLELGINEPPTWPLLVQLARRYNTTADYLLGMTDDPGPRRDVPLPERVRDLVGLAVELTPDRQNELLALARVLCDAERHDVVREYRRMRAFVRRLPDGARMADILDEALRLAERGDLAGAWALVESLTGESFDEGGEEG